MDADWPAIAEEIRRRHQEAVAADPSSSLSRPFPIVVEKILSRGEKAFLHSYADNTTAIGLYESLGYRGRRDVVFTILSPAS